MLRYPLNTDADGSCKQKDGKFQERIKGKAKNQKHCNQSEECFWWIHLGLGPDKERISELEDRSIRASQIGMQGKKLTQ